MDFHLNDIQEAAQEAAREFADRSVRPGAAQRDREETFPADLVRQLGELGLLGILIPEKYGGGGGELISYALSLMEIARADAGLAVTMSVNNLVASAILRYGSDAQKQHWLPRMADGSCLGAFSLTEPQAGSDASNLRTRAAREGDEYVLDGAKLWVTNGGYAGLYLVMAVTNPEDRRHGISSFLVPGDAEGLEIGAPEPKMGLHSSVSVSLALNGVRVPAQNRLGKEGEGLQIALSSLDEGRIGIASQSVGIIMACLDEARRYANEREAFGGPISRLQAIQWMIADSAVDLEASRLLALQAAWLKEQRRPFTQAASIAKLFASEAANRTAYRAVQIHGGYGYSREYAVERLYRDARVTTLYEGTSEIQRLVIARKELGL